MTYFDKPYIWPIKTKFDYGVLFLASIEIRQCKDQEKNAGESVDFVFARDNDAVDIFDQYAKQIDDNTVTSELWGNGSNSKKGTYKFYAYKLNENEYQPDGIGTPGTRPLVLANALFSRREP